MTGQYRKTATTSPDAVDTAPASPRRRRLLGLIAAGTGVAAAGSWPFARALATGGGAGDGAQATGKVRIMLYNNQGQRVGEREVERVVKTAAQWKDQLSPLAYRVTRKRGTERPFSGDYKKPDQAGIYRCICCNTALYDAATQFHSGTGWPSFWRPIAADNIEARTDTRLGRRRTEVLCKRCEAHLGHVFHDGPQPTGLRYCMNSVALRFTPTTAA